MGLKIIKNWCKSSPESLWEFFWREIEIQTSKNIARSDPRDAKGPPNPSQNELQPSPKSIKKHWRKSIDFGSVFSMIFLVFWPPKPLNFHYLFRRAKIRNPLKFYVFFDLVFILISIKREQCDFVKTMVLPRKNKCFSRVRRQKKNKPDAQKNKKSTRFVSGCFSKI